MTPLMTTTRLLTALGLGLTLASATAAIATAAPMTYTATLSGKDEVPATDSKATGTLEASFDAASRLLTWKGSYLGLTGPATAAHFHGPAPVGQKAGVEVPVPTIASPFEGKATLTDSQVKDLQAGQLYFNIHTAAHADGEIRGQVIPAK